MASGRSPAFVTPALVRWARTTAGFDVAAAARKLKVATATLEAWEEGTKHPSLAQARRMVTLYKRPLAIFFLPEPPRGFTPLRDFRTISGRARPQESPRLALETRRAHQRREAALELAASLGETPRAFSLTAALSRDPRAIAADLRALLDVSFDVQFSWRGQYEALNGWKAAVERAGTLVFQTESLPLREARGFSLALFPLPVVALNAKDTVRGRIFTLMHELAHIVLRSGGVCDLHDDAGSARDVDRVEVFCNRVAGAVLMPPSSVPASIAALGLDAERDWDEEPLSRLADLYGISTDATLRGLVLAGRFPAERYAARHDDFVRAWERERPKPGRVPYFRRALGWAGRRFARLALSAYDEQRISSADLTEYLRVKMPQVEQIRSALRKEDHAESA